MPVSWVDECITERSLCLRICLLGLRALCLWRWERERTKSLVRADLRPPLVAHHNCTK